MIRKFITLIGTIGIVVGFIAFVSVMGSLRPKIKPLTPEITPPTVFFTTAQSGEVTLDVVVQGEVRPRTDINLTAEISGKIVRMSDKFVDGGAFNIGDMLVKIEDADYRVAVTSAKARLAQAEEALRREEAEARLAQRDYAELGASGESNELALRLPQLAQARAFYESAEADLNAAQLNLARTEIKAPFKGRVRTRNAGVGQFVSPGAQIGRIFSTDVAEIRLSLTDNDLAKLGLPVAFVETKDEKGPPVVLSALLAGKLHQWTARVARTDGAIDPATRQVSAIAVVEDPYGAAADAGAPLAMGLFVDARISGRPIPEAIVLPRSALYGRDTVYVIAAENRLEERRVEIVSTDRDTITIVAGVSSNERVVTSPLRGAAPGSIVTPLDPNDANDNSGAEELDAATGAIAKAGANL